MKLKEVRMLKITDDVPYVQVRYHFTGPWHRIQIRNKRKLPEELQFQPTYNSRLPLNPHKYNDILKLTDYLSSPVSHNFYADLLGSVITSEATSSQKIISIFFIIICVRVLFFNRYLVAEFKISFIFFVTKTT